MTTHETLLFEIKTAQMRLAWAKAEAQRSGNTPALSTYLVEATEELTHLLTKKSKLTPRT
jgi:hypothetical protein